MITRYFSDDNSIGNSGEILYVTKKNSQVEKYHYIYLFIWRLRKLSKINHYLEISLQNQGR